MHISNDIVGEMPSAVARSRMGDVFELCNSTPDLGNDIGSRTEQVKVVAPNRFAKLDYPTALRRSLSIQRQPTSEAEWKSSGIGIGRSINKAGEWLPEIWVTVRGYLWSVYVP